MKLRAKRNTRITDTNTTLYWVNKGETIELNLDDFEVVGAAFKQQRESIVDLLEGMKRPIYFDNHGSPTEEDDLVRNHMVDEAIQKIKDFNG